MTPHRTSSTHRHRTSLWLLSLSLILLPGCIENFLGDDIADTPENNFEVFWQDMDRFYALFELKGIDWDSLYTVYRPHITPATSKNDLFATLCEMIRPLNDGHVAIQTEAQTCTSIDPDLLPENDLNLRVVERLLSSAFAFRADGRLQYGRIVDTGKTLGYIYIQNFAGSGTPVAGWVDELDAILDELSGVDGLIIDVRANSGGNGFNAADLAGRFTDARRPYLVTRTRNGPAHTDFTPPRTWYVQPRGNSPFLKPVAVLTNRYTFSAGEWFVLAMRTLPHTTIIGDRTGGGLSSRLFRTLPNGWSFSISIQQTGTPDGAFYEEVGVEPDLLVIPNRGAIVRPDVILREAIRLLSEG